MFKKGDVVQAKKEWLEPNETQESTIGIVVDYYPENDYLKIGVLNPQDYVFPPVLNARGCYYETVNLEEEKQHERMHTTKQ
jgi:hypothetical protein